ncbi:hypothetical protein [Dolichospermum flos-aquae]|uniref:hypothetical protein n=1 Tax=Dolichospermum flosaquae TaxID=1166 RepID=UPI001F2B0715|nr:hypothetical protein [Dolichospermum flos-aquae]
MISTTAISPILTIPPLENGDKLTRHEIVEIAASSDDIYRLDVGWVKRQRNPTTLNHKITEMLGNIL